MNSLVASVKDGTKTAASSVRYCSPQSWQPLGTLDSDWRPARFQGKRTAPPSGRTVRRVRHRDEQDATDAYQAMFPLDHSDKPYENFLLDHGYRLQIEPFADWNRSDAF